MGHRTDINQITAIAESLDQEARKLQRMIRDVRRTSAQLKDVIEGRDRGDNEYGKPSDDQGGDTPTP